MTPAISRLGRLGLTLALASTCLLSARASFAQAGSKIGVFDKQRIVDESDLGKSVKSRFEKQQADREAELDGKQKAYDAAQKAYDQQNAVLSDEKRLDRQRELARMRDELQSAAGNADRDLERAYKQALLELVQKLDPVITEFAKAEGYDFLFDQQQYAYARDGFDVTDKIIAKVNAQFPASAAPAATASTTPK
jgi:outer membrane protein